MTTESNSITHLSEYEQMHVKNFLATIALWDDAYRDASFSFIGLIQNNEIILMQGALHLSNSPPDLTQKLIKTKSLLAGYFPLTEKEAPYTDFLTTILAGSVSTPFGDIKLMSDERNKISAHFNGPSGLLGDDRLRDTKLDIYGAAHPQTLNAQMLSLELRCADEPYESIQELASELMLNPSQGDRATIAVTAFHVAQLDVNTRVTGTSAKIGVFLSRRLDTNLISVGYRVIVQGRVVERTRVGGDAFTWVANEKHWDGTCTVVVPLGAVLQCFVSYNGQAQHHGWIADPDTFPNARRTAHNAFDPGLQVLRNYLFEEKIQRVQSRDFEVGIANLLFLLGFSVDPFVGKPLEEGPDLLATTNSGNLLVIECTTSVINKDGKLGKLVDRVESVRQKLKSASINHLRVLPVIVTCRPKQAIAEKEEARSLGIVVVAFEDLEKAIDRTVLLPDTDVLFNQAWESVQPRDVPLLQGQLLPTALGL